MYKYSKERKLKKLNILLKVSVSCVVVLAVIVSGVVFAKMRNRTIATVPVSVTEPVSPPSEVSLVMVGDNLMHMSLVRNAELPDGSMNFDSLYEEMLPYFQEAGLTVE